MPRSPSEQIIAEAIMSGEHDTGMRRLTCNIAAVQQITCRCGDVLDQRTVHVIEKDGKTWAALCPACFIKVKSGLIGLQLITWDREETIA